MTLNQLAGKALVTTALLTAVVRTPSSFASAARPIASQISRVVGFMNHTVVHYLWISKAQCFSGSFFLDYFLDDPFYLDYLLPNPAEETARCGRGMEGENG